MVSHTGRTRHRSQGAPSEDIGELSVEAELPAYVGLVLDVVDLIPAGRVMTYGDIAAVVGRGGPRMVGATMARYGSMVPWWRVVNARGELPAHLLDAALEQWELEGTPVRRVAPVRVRLPVARWLPEGVGAHPGSG